MAEFLEVEFQESIRLALANITGVSTTKISLPNAQRRETLTQRYELNTESSDEATDAVDAIISASDTDQLLSSLISALATTSYNGAQPTSTVTYGSPTKSSNWESSGLTWAPTTAPTPVPTESTGYVVSGSLNISGVSMAEFLEVEFQESIRLALANITGFSTTKISLPNAQRRETLTQRYELNTESSDEATDAVDAIISASDTDQLLSS